MSTQELKIESKMNAGISGYFNISVLILSFIYLVINHDVLQDLYHKWYAQELTGTYSHGLLVAIIVLYLVFKKIQNLKKNMHVNPSMVGFMILSGSQVVLFISVISGINFLQHILIVISLLAIVWSFYSYRIAKEFFLPAILFSLSFPVWGDAVYMLQKISVFLTNALLSISGVPFYHNREFFYFPSGIIEIATGCAGLQQLLVSLIIGLLFSAQHRLKTFDTIKTLIYISILSVFINSIRIIIVMIVGYFTKMESSLVSQHVILGWVIYGIGIYAFLFFYSRKNFKTTENTAVQDPDGKTGFRTKGKGIKYLTVVILLLLLPNTLSTLVNAKINNRNVSPASLYVTGNGWKKISDTLANINWKPALPPGDSLELGEYIKNSKTIYVSISSYLRIRPDVEPINMENRPYDRKYWTSSVHEELHIKNAEGHNSKLLFERLVSKNKEHLDVLNYYIVNGMIVDNLVNAKLAMLLGLLRFNYDVKIVCLAMKPTSESDDTKTQLINFYKNLKIH